MNVEVVLTQTDPKLGERGDVLKVAPGYAYNFLIPHKKAILATPQILKRFEAEKGRLAQRSAEQLSQVKSLAEKISNTSLVIELAAGETEKLYGAVNSQDIQEALKKHGVSVERKNIHLEEPIRKLGNYQIPVRFHSEAEAVLKLTVVKKKA